VAIPGLENPWRNLPEHPPFVLEIDRPAVHRFNAKVGDALKIHGELLPEPYVGDPAAPVILLNLNPGFSEADNDFYRDHRLLEAHRKNLLHEPTEYPFYFLNPGFDRTSGCLWWDNRLKQLIATAGRVNVAENVCCVEYFPYHSMHFRGGVQVPSQEYSFHLVRRAMERGALVVIMRGKRFWLDRVQQLSAYQHCHVLKNPQRVTISEGNCPDGYPRVLERVMRGETG